MRAAACQYCGLCLWLGNLYALASQITCILVIGLLRPPVSVAVENLYPVAIVLPAKGWPRTVLGAYLAVKHINECNNSVVQEAANICDSFKIKEVFVDSNFSPTGAVLAGNKANEINAVSVIGAIRSAASIPLAHVLSTTATPIVSPASASATLSSNTVFPLFSRVVPSNTESSKALARLVLVEFGWRKVAVLHQDDSYGSGFYQDFVSACRQLSVEHLNLTLADYEVSGAPVRQNHVEKSLAELKDRGYHVFCLVLLGDSFPLFFRSAAYLNMFRTGFTYITTDFDVSNVVQFPEEHGFDSPGAQRELSDALQGFLRVQFSPVSEPSYSRLDAAARAAGAGILPEEVAEGIAAEGKDPDEWMSLGLQGDVYSLYAYDAVWTVALALRKAERSVSDWSSGGCGSGGRCNGAALNRLIRSASFGGASGEVRFTSEVDDQGNTIHLGDRDVSGMDSLVQFYDNRTMAWVDAGRLGRGGYAAEREIVWPGMVEGGVPPDGRSCPAGAFFDEAELECRPCGAGAFRPSEGGLGCRPCPAGTFCDTEGCEVCSPCPIGSYQSGPGSTGCAICPSNTQTSGQGASSVGECRCVPGYYRRDGRSGEACYPCPDGGQCVGGAHPPYPRQGYWGDWSLVDSSTADSEEAAARIHKLVFHECAVQEDCTSEVREADLAEARAHIQGLGERSATEAAVMAEALRAVRSNASRVCSGRTEGVLCASCARGYYNLGGRCRECLRPYGVFVSGCIGGIILAWYLINRIMAGKIEAVDLTLIFFQNASTIGSFSLDWSEALERGPFNVLGILNFDVDFFNPDCLSTSTYTAWSYGHALVLQLLLPLAVAAALALFCLASTAAVRLREALAQHQVAPDGGPQGAGGSAWRALGLFGIATSREGIEAKKDSAWATVASFVNVIYHTLTLKCLEVFRCEELPDGSSFLSRAPGVECGTAYHRIYMAMGVLGLVVYSVGIPLAFMVILEYGRVHDLFSQERFSSRFGWLYLRYEKDWYFWELVIMARRVLLVAILVFAPHLPSVQILLGNAVICMAIAGHFYARPFIRRSTDQLEMVSVAALFGVLSTGILFNDANAQELYPVWEDVVTGMSCLFLFSGLFFVVNIVVREAITSRKRFSTGSQLRHLIMETLRNHCPVSDPTLGQSTSIVGSFLVSTLIPKIRKSCDLPRGPSKQRSAESDNADGSASPLSESGAEDKAKELRAWKKIRDSLSMEPLELNNTLDPAQILKWLSKNKSAASRRSSLSLTRRSRGNSVSRTSSNAAHRAAQPPEHMQLLAVRFWLINHWMQKTLCDTSTVSYYSRSHYSRFFGGLVAENPYLIDHFLSADSAMLEQIKASLNDLRISHMMFKREGRLASMINEIDRGPFLAWLMIAPPDAVGTVREMLEDIYQAFGGAPFKPSFRVRPEQGNAKLTDITTRLIKRWLPSPRVQLTTARWTLDSSITSGNIFPEAREGQNQSENHAHLTATLAATDEGKEVPRGDEEDPVEPHRSRALQGASEAMAGSQAVTFKGRGMGKVLRRQQRHLDRLDMEMAQSSDFVSEVSTYLRDLERDLSQRHPFR